MASTGLNLLLDIGFNREVAGDSALYWDKKEGSLSYIIEQSDSLDIEKIRELEDKAKKRITKKYMWQTVVDKYERIFIGEIMK